MLDGYRDIKYGRMAENIISYKILFNVYIIIYIVDNVVFDCLRIVSQKYISTQILQILYEYIFK